MCLKVRHKGEASAGKHWSCASRCSVLESNIVSYYIRNSQSYSLRVLVFMLRVCMLYMLVLHESGQASCMGASLSPLLPHLCPKKCGTLKIFSICDPMWVTKVGHMSENTGFAPPMVLCWRVTSSHITLAIRRGEEELTPSSTRDW